MNTLHSDAKCWMQRQTACSQFGSCQEFYSLACRYHARLHDACSKMMWKGGYNVRLGDEVDSESLLIFLMTLKK